MSGTVDVDAQTVLAGASHEVAAEERREFLQHRVSRFGRMGALVFGMYLLYRVFADRLAWGEFQFSSSMQWHLAGVVVLSLPWMVCRRGRRSVRFIRTIESVCVMGIGATVVLMGQGIGLAHGPQLVVLLALTLSQVVWAVYVPGSTYRTAAHMAVLGVPVVAGSYVQYRGMDVERWATLVPGLTGASSSDVAASVAYSTAAWWLCICLVCVAATSVVHGLRVRLRETQRLGQYTLHEKIGAGGMGVVYRAHHAMLRRPTAVKLMGPAQSGEDAPHNFEREVQTTANLTHPNTITVFDYGRTPDGLFYYAMEFLDGATVDEVVAASGAQDPRRVVHTVAQAADALQEAHAIDFVHRDIKPANIMLCTQGGHPDFVKVLDFGLVHDIKADDVSVAGTPQYMPPEAFRLAGKIDARSDIYALGAVAYFMLTGEHVFNGDTLDAICRQHLASKPVSPSERLGTQVPAELEALIMRCLAKDPADRPQSASELHDQLRACDGLEPWQPELARRWWSKHGEHVTEHRTGLGDTMMPDTVAVNVAQRMWA